MRSIRLHLRLDLIAQPATRQLRHRTMSHLVQKLLPPELIIQILNELSYEDVLICRQVSRTRFLGLAPVITTYLPRKVSRG